MRRLLSPAWLARHGLVLLVVPGFLGLGWWQYQRASSGNALSWGYTIQWPVFAAFVGYLWWREVRQELRGTDRAAAPTPTLADGFRAPVVTRRRPARDPVALLAPAVTATDVTAAGASEPDREVDEYNRYLAWLAANPGARAADYPG
ncbi:hypothetical protein [Pilimelia columellifera]|uniref:DNA-binding transcriptional regulator of glucitol operon n=1 Tax=Pilimelia columellifera subsp. columellifera TaxID=706583 RepID=A0ABN3NPU9_9ACTN